MEKEILYQKCREQEIEDNTYCLWHEATLGMPPMCSMDVGGWIWNDDFDTLVKCYKEVVLWDSAAMACGYDEYVEDDKSTIELLEICASDFNTAVADQKRIKQIINLIKTPTNTLDEFVRFIRKSSKLFKELGVDIFSDVYVGFEEAFEWVCERLDGTVPMYETKKEYLLNDEV